MKTMYLRALISIRHSRASGNPVFYEPFDFIHSELDPRLRGDDAFWSDRSVLNLLNVLAGVIQLA